jgi:predicted DNA-binding mobile mystery protein A
MKRLNDRARERLDERLASAKPTEQLQPPPRGWIRAIRDSIGMTGAQLGTRLGTTRQNVDKLEKAEASGAIQLQTLRKVAEALDMEFVYALVPRTSLDDMVRSRARRLAQRAIGRVSQTMKLEAQDTGTRDLEQRIDEYIRDELSDRELWSGD